MNRLGMAAAVALLGLLAAPYLSPANAAPISLAPMSTLSESQSPVVDVRYRRGFCTVRRVRYCVRRHGVKYCSRWRVVSVRCYR